MRKRCGHYTFAHVALRQIAFDDPLTFLGVLASPDAMRFLADVLRQVREHCKDVEPLADFSVEEVTVHKRRIGRFPCAIIEMPPPQEVPEAFFVGAVLLVDPTQEIDESKGVDLHYYTLEKGAVFEGVPRTVLCEWTADGSHLNFGFGPPPTVDAFFGVLEEWWGPPRD